MEEARKLIIEIENIFPYTNKRIEYFKEECIRLKKDNIVFEDYLSNLGLDFYKIINEMILFTNGNKNCSIIQKAKIKEYLPEVTAYFFDDFLKNSDVLKNFWYWNFIVDFNMKPKDKQGIYINPKEFTKEYVTSIVNSLLKENENKPKVINNTDRTWFIVGLKFVDGTVYECKKIESSGTKLVELAFENEFLNLEKEEKDRLKLKYRNPINGSLDIDGYKDRTLFKNDSIHQEHWREIYDYQKKQGGKIDKRFEEKFLKTYNVTIE